MSIAASFESCRGSGGNVTLSDILPSGTTFASVASGWSYTTPAATHSTVICSMATLAASASAALILVMTVAANTAGGASVTNTAIVAVATNGDSSGPPSAAATVTVQTQVDGVCGSDNGQILLAAPTNLCSAGDATAVSGSGHPWNWNCNGTDGGTTASCSADIRTWTVNAIVPGGGGQVEMALPPAPPTTRTVDNGTSISFDAFPNIGFSLAGASGCGATTVGNRITTATITANCTVTVTFSENPVNGMCGTDNYQVLSRPPIELCEFGAATPVVGNGPWTWSCEGSLGGTTATCSADAIPYVVLVGNTPIAKGDTSPSASKGTDFGNVQIGTQAVRNFTINNPAGLPAPTGNAPKTANASGATALALQNAASDLFIGSISSSNPAFTISGGTGRVPKGGSAQFSVIFNATTFGAQNATISIETNSFYTFTFTFAVTSFAVDTPTPGSAVPAPALDARLLLLLITALATVGQFALRRGDSRRRN